MGEAAIPPLPCASGTSDLRIDDDSTSFGFRPRPPRAASKIVNEIGKSGS